MPQARNAYCWQARLPRPVCGRSSQPQLVQNLNLTDRGCLIDICEETGRDVVALGWQWVRRLPERTTFFDAFLDQSGNTLYLTGRNDGTDIG